MIQRYSLWGAESVADEGGAWVRHADHEAELAKWKEVAKLLAEDARGTLKMIGCEGVPITSLVVYKALEAQP